MRLRGLLYISTKDRFLLIILLFFGDGFLLNAKKLFFSDNKFNDIIPLSVLDEAVKVVLHDWVEGPVRIIFPIGFHQLQSLPPEFLFESCPLSFNQIHIFENIWFKIWLNLYENSFCKCTGAFELCSNFRPGKFFEVILLVILIEVAV